MRRMSGQLRGTWSNAYTGDRDVASGTYIKTEPVGGRGKEYWLSVCRL